MRRYSRTPLKSATKSSLYSFLTRRLEVIVVLIGTAVGKAWHRPTLIVALFGTSAKSRLSTGMRATFTTLAAQRQPQQVRPGQSLGYHNCVLWRRYRFRTASE
jgi:hypothetical protein